MKSYLSILLLMFGGAIATSAQQPAPKPTPPDDDVVKIRTNLIQIDVSVTDKNGKPITDLKPEEVEVYENGQKQKLTHFSFVSSTMPVKAAPTPKPSNTDAPVPVTTLRQDQIRR